MTRNYERINTIQPNDCGLAGSRIRKFNTKKLSHKLKDKFMVNGYTAVRSALLSTSNKGSISRTYFQILQDKEHIHLPARHERKGPSFNAHVTRG